MIDITAQRLQAQRLVGEQPESAVEVVRSLGAVQSQDYAGASWAIGQRTADTTRAEIDRLFDEGAILRTHVMRPTWHFVLPEDIRWLLDLTGPRVRLTLAGRFRRLGIGEGDVARAREIIGTALAEERALTRAEIGARLRAAGIVAEGLGLVHLLMAAELDGVIVSGPRRGKEFTYALLSERAPGARQLDRDRALAELARRYFGSHGPAQVSDFAWWSGLTLTDARRGLALAAAHLRRMTIENKEYWCAADMDMPTTPAPISHLLPNWDEYTVAYRDREAIVPADRPLDPSDFPYGALSNVLTIAGHVWGTWRWIVARRSTRVEVRPLDRLDRPDIAAVEHAVGRLKRFLAAPVDLEWKER